MKLLPRLACLLLLLSALPAWAFETAATHAWVYDMTTGTVLLDKNGEVPVPPASMSKLMTVEMLFEALQDKRVQMDTSFGVSAKAVAFTAQGGSTMYLQQGDRPTVNELIQGMIVNSVSTLSTETENMLRQAYPGIDLNQVLLLEQGRKPTSQGFTTGLLIGGVGLIVCAAAMGLIALVYRPTG